MKLYPYTPWEWNICRPIDPPGTTPGLIGIYIYIYGSPISRVWGILETCRHLNHELCDISMYLKEQ